MTAASSQWNCCLSQHTSVFEVNDVSQAGSTSQQVEYTVLAVFQGKCPQDGGRGQFSCRQLHPV